MKRTILIAAVATLGTGLALAQNTTPGKPGSTPNPSSQSTAPNSSNPNSNNPNRSTPTDTVPGSTSPSTPSRDPGDQSNQGFASIDSDGDGRISRAEAATDRKLGRGFSQADTNGDGYLDTGEYTSRSKSGSDSSSPGTTPPSDPPRQ